MGNVVYVTLRPIQSSHNIFALICFVTFQVVQALLEKGTDPNKVLSNGNPAIFAALETENKYIMKALSEGRFRF